MEIEVKEVKINNNLTPLKSLTSPTISYASGFKEITFKGLVKDSKDLDVYMFNSKPIDSINSPIGILKECYIENLSYDPGNPGIITIEGIARDIIPTIEVNFKDCKATIDFSQYCDIMKNHGKLEEMTFNEFKDYVMVDEL